MNISNRDIEILELFCKRAREIANSSIFRDNKYKVSLTISGKRGEEVKFTETAPEKEALVALITILRQYYAPGESINFNKVYNLVWKYLDEKDPKVKKCAAWAIKGFKQIQKQSQLAIIVNGRKLTPIEIIDLWFNANIFHADLDKVKKFEQLSRSRAAPFIAFEFKSAIINLSNVIMYFSSFVEAEILSTR